ncbi:MAG: helix-turn-helix domain-containing protein [Salibacteraceae bacterium]
MEWSQIYTSLDIMSLAGTIVLVVFLARSRKIPGKKGLLGACLLQVFTIYLFDWYWSEHIVPVILQEMLQLGLGSCLLEYLLDWRSPPAAWRWWIHAGIGMVNLCMVGASFALGWTPEFFFASAYYFALEFFNLLAGLGYTAALLATFFTLRGQIPALPKPKMHWAMVLSISFGGLFLILFTSEFVTNVAGESELLWVFQSAASFLLVVYFLWQSYRLGFFVGPIAAGQISEVAEEDERWKKLFAKLDDRIRNESWYLQPQLKVDDLAQRMQTNSRYISKAVNEAYGDSVTNYLNALRIEHFKRELAKPTGRQYALDALALDCGFNSKSSFNRLFKQHEGMTPSAYRDGVGGG